MAKKPSSPATAVDVAQLLVDVAGADATFRDVYLRRAYVLLTARRRALRSLQRQIDALARPDANPNRRPRIAP